MNEIKGDQPMKSVTIGWANRDVTTDKPVSIPGQFHARISEGVCDPVSVTALVIDNGEDHNVPTDSAEDPNSRRIRAASLDRTHNVKRETA
ncbi:hypothetical protein ACFLQU_04455 [Verrucomicrobiota bacterium]